MNVLIIEDEYSLADAIAETLKKDKFNVNIETNGEDGENEALTENYDLILLDVMLPKKNGFDILRTIGQEKIKTPVIMLTAKSEIEDKLNGLEHGADDYITKPFSNRELVARVRALLRRVSRIEDKTVNIETDGLVMNLEARTVTIKGKEIKLRPKEFDLLYMFLLKPNVVLNREYILENVFDYNIGVTTRTIDTHIKNLRQALGSWGDRINTIFGRGFKFVPDVKKK